MLRPVERLLTKAVTAPRDEDEQKWITTVRRLLEELRKTTSEVNEALKEFAEQGRLGWKSAGEVRGLSNLPRPSPTFADLLPPSRR